MIDKKFPFNVVLPTKIVELYHKGNGELKNTHKQNTFIYFIFSTDSYMKMG